MDNTFKQNEDKAEDMEDWRDEHGQPSFEYLESLVVDGSPQALAKLRSIAEDLNVSYEVDTPMQELVEQIRMATRNESETTT